MKETTKGILIKWLFFFALWSVGFQVHALDGKVVKVVDGDTITVLTRENQQVKIRLDQIDAPEKKQPWGENSRLALAKLLAGRQVAVEVSGLDRYGRTIGTVMLETRNINKELVATGNAWVYRKYLKDHGLLDIEMEARSRKLGIWSLPVEEAVPPWEFRKRQRTDRANR